MWAGTQVERLEERAAHAGHDLEHSQNASSLTQAQRARQIEACSEKLETCDVMKSEGVAI